MVRRVPRRGGHPIEDHAYIGELISALVYLYAGARLLRLSYRTSEVPERLLGAMFLVTGASFLLYDIPIILDDESLWTPLTFAGRVAYLPAPVLLAIFTRRVFRPDRELSPASGLQPGLWVPGISFIVGFCRFEAHSL